MANEHLILVYQELCATYRAIDDFRAKLLGFLPLVSGAGIFFLLDQVFAEQAKRDMVLQSLEPIGLFGCAVTLGLFSFELYGVKKCHAILMAGKKLERSLKESSGQFITRPRSIAHVVNEPFASGIIYPAVFAAWVYIALLFRWLDNALTIAVIVFGVGFVGTLLYDQLLQWSDRKRERAEEEEQKQSSQTPTIPAEVQATSEVVEPI